VRDATLAEQAALIASQAADFDALTVELSLSREQADVLLAELGQLRDRRQALEAELADADELTVLRQSKIDRADLRIETLVAALDETQAALDESQQLGAQSTAEVARLNAQLAAVQAEMARLSAILDERERQSGQAGATVLVNSDRVNQALVDRVQRLLDEQNDEVSEGAGQAVEIDGQALAEVQRYFSEFFQQLDSVLGERADVQVEGDRFVFQSKVLFASAQAELGVAGRLQLSSFARTLLDLSQNIPPEIDWVLRVDGHTDSIPIQTAQFPSNWELSAARAVSVVKYLIEAGVPKNRLVAAAYGQHSPISTEDNEPNRRIEMKLDQR
jgi:chemotaxis protein MotB